MASLRTTLDALGHHGAAANARTALERQERLEQAADEVLARVTAAAPCAVLAVVAA